VQPYDPPEDMQIRPVQWRQRGLEDHDDDSGYGRALVDYDPLADEDDYDFDDDDDFDDEDG